MKENNSLKAKTISGVIWKFGERVSAQLVNFIVSIILARLLLPEDYGLIALVTVFITICNKIVVSGFATSLVQKKDADNLDFSTVFYFSVCVAAILYAVLFATAPFIADFYSKESDPQLFIQVIRVMGLNLFIIAVNSVQQAYVSRTMQFRKFFFSTIAGTVVSAIAGIALAYAGKGVWALVAQNMILALVNGIVLWFMVKWRPQLKFSFKRLKALYSYGWKIFVASMIKILYTDLRSLVIGRVYTAADLAFYNKAQSFPQLIDTNVEGTIDSVLFSAISKKQNSVDEMRAMLRRAIKTTSFILMPLLAGLSAVAKPFIIILLTDKWAESIPLMQILAFSFIFAPVELENLQAIKALGRSDVALKVEIIKKVLGIIILIISIPFGVTAIAIGMVISTTLSAIINAIPNKKLLGYTFKMQLADILPSLLLSLVMFAAVYSISLLDLNIFLMLTLQVGVGAIIYISLSAIFKVESFRYIISIIKNFLRRGNKNES
ncbi:MAG: lipopolysaccharide biosynthesis protein [Acutalibacteraceae bacterium]|nr:lipopolysaccharide biosynthesis protein [Acutalibacteraceae bacterium]